MLCSQLGYYINKRELLKYSLGLFHGINTMEDARKRLSTILRILKDCCLCGLRAWKAPFQVLRMTFLHLRNLCVMMMGCRKLLRNQNSSVFVSFEDDVVKVQEVPHHKGYIFLSLSDMCLFL